MGILLVLLLQCSLWNIQQHLPVQSPRNRWNSLNEGWNVPTVIPWGINLGSSLLMESNMCEGGSEPSRIFVNTGHTGNFYCCRGSNLKLIIMQFNPIKLYSYKIVTTRMESRSLTEAQSLTPEQATLAGKSSFYSNRKKPQAGPTLLLMDDGVK